MKMQDISNGAVSNTVINHKFADSRYCEDSKDTGFAFHEALKLKNIT